MKHNASVILICALSFLYMNSSEGLCMEIEPKYERAPFQSPIQSPIIKTTTYRRKNPTPMRALPKNAIQKFLNEWGDFSTEQNVATPKVQRNILGDDDYHIKTVQKRNICPKTYAPECRVFAHTITSFDQLQTDFFNNTTAIFLDFDGTLARRVFNLTSVTGEPLKIRYAASTEWNSDMYRPIFADVLSELGKTTYDFDKLFKYVKDSITYEVLDPSFSNMNFYNIGTKRVISGLKDKDGQKTTLCDEKGFSYTHARKKAREIANFCKENPSITNIIFMDNNPDNVEDVQKNLPPLLNDAYDHPTTITVHVLHFDYFKQELERHKDDLKREMQAMFDVAERSGYEHKIEEWVVSVYENPDIEDQRQSFFQDTPKNIV